MLDSLWQRMLVTLEPRIAPTVIDLWIRPCKVVGLEGDHLRIAAPSSFARDRQPPRGRPTLLATAANCRINWPANLTKHGGKWRHCNIRVSARAAGSRCISRCRSAA